MSIAFYTPDIFTPAVPTDKKSPSELGSLFTDTRFPAIAIPLPALYLSTNDLVCPSRIGLIDETAEIQDGGQDND